MQKAERTVQTRTMNKGAVHLVSHPLRRFPTSATAPTPTRGPRVDSPQDASLPLPGTLAPSSALPPAPAALPHGTPSPRPLRLAAATPLLPLASPRRGISPRRAVSFGLRPWPVAAGPSRLFASASPPPGSADRRLERRGGVLSSLASHRPRGSGALVCHLALCPFGGGCWTSAAPPSLFKETPLADLGVVRSRVLALQPTIMTL